MIPRRMRAAWYERCGPARQVLIVAETDTPQPKVDEVLVRVAFSGVNPHDTKKRSGWTGPALPAPRVIPHADAAGTIAAVGPDVPQARVGERVWVFRADTPPGAGAAAEYTVVKAEHAVPLPAHVSFEVGACLGVPALTAHRAVFADGSVAGKTVLVTGGAGAVASYAIQLAVRNGARVIATISSAAKAAHAKALGAEHTIDYKTTDVAAAVMEITNRQGVDRIIEVDFGANLPVTRRIMKPHCVISAYSSTRLREPILPYYDFAMKDATLHFVQGLLLGPARAEAVRDISALLQQDRLKHHVAKVYPLARIADAHEALEAGGHIGKILVAS